MSYPKCKNCGKIEYNYPNVNFSEICMCSYEEKNGIKKLWTIDELIGELKTSHFHKKDNRDKEADIAIKILKYLKEYKQPKPSKWKIPWFDWKYNKK